MASPHPKYTAKELEKKIAQYFNSLKYADKEGNERQKPMTVSGLAYYLGFESRQSIYDYKIRNKDEKSAYLIKRTILFIESQYETMLNKPSGNIAGIIFWLKNHGWKDRSEEQENNEQMDTLFKLLRKSLDG